MRIEELAPGMVQYLSPGEKLTFTNPSASQGDIGYVADRLHAIAAGIGITYEQLTEIYHRLIILLSEQGR